MTEPTGFLNISYSNNNFQQSQPPVVYVSTVNPFTYNSTASDMGPVNSSNTNSITLSTGTPTPQGIDIYTGQWIYYLFPQPSSTNTTYNISFANLPENTVIYYLLISSSYFDTTNNSSYLTYPGNSVIGSLIVNSTSSGSSGNFGIGTYSLSFTNAYVQQSSSTTISGSSNQSITTNPGTNNYSFLPTPFQKIPFTCYFADFTGSYNFNGMEEGIAGGPNGQQISPGLAFIYYQFPSDSVSNISSSYNGSGCTIT